MRKLLVAHVIPSAQIGGVETGVQKALGQPMAGLQYRAYVVEWRRTRGDLTSMDAPWVGRLLRECIGGQRPDVVVTSLWKAHLFGALFGMFGCKWAAYFHSARFAHRIDRMIGRWAARRADVVMADSLETASFLSRECAVQARVVPLMFERGRAAEKTPVGSPTFVYVGRHVGVKRIDLVAELVTRLASTIEHARFLFVGPAGPSTEIVETLRRRLGDRVVLVGPLANEKVIKVLEAAHFSMLMSDVEGLSMATVEALQCGAVPIVRPVGEIARYCNDDNAIMVRETSAAALQAVAEKVLAVCSDPSTFARMSDSAARTCVKWQTFPQALSEVLTGITVGRPA